jgi:NADH-quinone oxidoreductase subunit A
MINTVFALSVMAGLAGGICVVLLVLATLVGPKKYGEVKDDPFECGTVGTGSADQRFSVQFYLVAMIFILFDIEIAFMYPWAVTLQDIGWMSFWGMMPFLVVVELGLLYIWRRGVLDWL